MTKNYFSDNGASMPEIIFWLQQICCESNSGEVKISDSRRSTILPYVTSAGTRTPGRARLAHSPKEKTRRPLTALNPHPSSVPPKGRYTARRSGTKHQVSQGNRTHCRKGEEAASVIHLIGNTGKKKRKGKKAHLFSAPSGRTRRTVTFRDPLFSYPKMDELGLFYVPKNA